VLLAGRGFQAKEHAIVQFMPHTPHIDAHVTRGCRPRSRRMHSRLRSCAHSCMCSCMCSCVRCAVACVLQAVQPSPCLSRFLEPKGRLARVQSVCSLESTERRRLCACSACLSVVAHLPVISLLACLHCACSSSGIGRSRFSEDGHGRRK